MRIGVLSRRSRWRRLVLFGTATLLIGWLLLAVKMAPWRHNPLAYSLPEVGVSSRPTNPFFIGAFLRNLVPGNTSFCAFPFGNAENFSISDDVVMGSPELGDKGPYRVVYNAVQGTLFNSSSETVTFATHATLEYVVHIAEIARSWDGPVSVACYLPSVDILPALLALETLCYCEPAMKNVSVHLIFHSEHPFNMTSSINATTNDTCSIPTSLLNSTCRNSLGLPYPVNVARNVARQGSQTKFLLVADIELFPSTGLAKAFLEMLTRMPKRRSGDYSFLRKRHVYVVPVFEVAADVRALPKTKRELLSLHANEKAVYFHKYVCLHCQRFPGLLQWLQRRDNPHKKSNLVEPRLVVRREFPHHRWEPVYIGTHREPLYSELLIWEGQQDKMAQMYEMCLLDYRFVILDGAFLVHTPGIKQKKTRNRDDNSQIKAGNKSTSTGISNQWAHHMQRNSYLYRIITQDLVDKYGENHRCRKK